MNEIPPPLPPPQPPSTSSIYDESKGVDGYVIAFVIWLGMVLGFIGWHILNMVF